MIILILEKIVWQIAQAQAFKYTLLLMIVYSLCFNRAFNEGNYVSSRKGDIYVTDIFRNGLYSWPKYGILGIKQLTSCSDKK